MTPQRYEQIRQAFLDLRERPQAERRAAIAEICGDDIELRAEVESLLEHDHDAQGTFASPARGRRGGQCGA